MPMGFSMTFAAFLISFNEMFTLIYQLDPDPNLTRKFRIWIPNRGYGTILFLRGSYGIGIPKFFWRTYRTYNQVKVSDKEPLRTD
jgi:hypothetical protein